MKKGSRRILIPKSNPEPFEPKDLAIEQRQRNTQGLRGRIDLRRSGRHVLTSHRDKSSWDRTPLLPGCVRPPSPDLSTRSDRPVNLGSPVRNLSSASWDLELRVEKAWRVSFVYIKGGGKRKGSDRPLSSSWRKSQRRGANGRLGGSASRRINVPMSGERTSFTRDVSKHVDRTESPAAFMIIVALSRVASVDT